MTTLMMFPDGNIKLITNMYEEIFEVAECYEGKTIICEGNEFIIEVIRISSLVNSHECWAEDKEGNKLRVDVEYDFNKKNI